MSIQEPERHYPPPTSRRREPSKPIHPKVIAAGAGGGLAGPLAVILTYHFPSMPMPVAAAYTAILVTLAAIGAGYLVSADK